MTQLSTKLSVQVYRMEKVLEQARQALKFYADLKYSDKMGLPPEVQWIAEEAIKTIDALNAESSQEKS